VERVDARDLVSRLLVVVLIIRSYLLVVTPMAAIREML
jgi:hypothetical protein